MSKMIEMMDQWLGTHDPNSMTLREYASWYKKSIHKIKAPPKIIIPSKKLIKMERLIPTKREESHTLQLQSPVPKQKPIIEFDIPVIKLQSPITQKITIEPKSMYQLIKEEREYKKMEEESHCREIKMEWSTVHQSKLKTKSI